MCKTCDDGHHKHRYSSYNSLCRNYTSSRKITFITEQSYELLDEKTREALRKQNGAGSLVDRTWLFDSISWYAPQDFVAYDAIRRR